MCTCPAALNKAAAALYGVNCVIKGENPQESCAEALVISFLGKKACQMLTYGRKLRNV